MMSRRRRLLIGVGITLVIGLMVYLIVSLNSRHNVPTGSINLLVAPSDSTLRLDGRKVKSGELKAKAGNHTVIASRDGFASQTKTVNLKAKQTEFVGIILQPDTAATRNWYTTHPADNSLVQSINNRSFDQAGKNALANNPLLADLPYLGPGTHYRIDYGSPPTGTTSSYPYVYIRYDSDEAKQDALTWIKNRGYNPASMNIIYIGVPLNSLQ